MTDHSAHGPQESPTPAGGDGMNQGMRVLSSLIAGVLLYGGLGWLGDHFLGTGFLLPVGIVLGAACGCYVTIKRLNASLALQPPADPSSRLEVPSATNADRRKR